MNIIITLGHPAHLHLFRNAALCLHHNGHHVIFVITEKDILIKLLDEYEFDYRILAGRKKNESFTDKIVKIYNSTIALNRIVKSFRPDIMVGCLSQMAWVGFFRRIPTIFFGEDDFKYTWLFGISTFPFVSTIMSPYVTKVGPFNRKKISYNGYQKLAYLHPNQFTPNKENLKGIDLSKPFYVIRRSTLSAYHDINIKGLNLELLLKIIDILEKKGQVYISSEKGLPDNLSKYKLPVNVKYIYDVLYYSSLFIGDGQSMAVESAILGVPNIRYNDFAGRVSVLNELENVYHLTVSIDTKHPDRLFKTIEEIINDDEVKKHYNENKARMLADKIDVTAFFVWFIENYPESKKIMRGNPDYQYNFK